jgi:hypothetical protein
MIDIDKSYEYFQGTEMEAKMKAKIMSFLKSVIFSNVYFISDQNILL